MYNRTKTTGSKARELWTDVTSCTLDWSRLLEFYLLNFQRCMWTRPLKASLAPSRVVSSDQWPSHWPGPTWLRPLDRRCRRTCRSFKVARKNQRRRLHVALLATDLTIPIFLAISPYCSESVVLQSLSRRMHQAFVAVGSLYNVLSPKLNYLEFFYHVCELVIWVH